MRDSNDGTFKDYCRHYGGDCGDCFKIEKGFPECYEDFPGEHGPEEYCHACSKAGGAEKGISHLPPVCKDN